MQHFLEIERLSLDEVEQLIARAIAFKKGLQSPSYLKKKMAALFYENSTRTRMSFELAAKNLSISMLHYDNALSSEIKGESFEDTLANLIAMGIHLFVIRHPKEKFFSQLETICPKGVHLINAGDGKHEHPSQALLDLMTIFLHKPQLASIKIALIGNISHSRVANSLQLICKLMGVGELVLVAPKIWQPSHLHFGRVTDSLYEGLKEADVVMCLRVQKERLQAGESLDLEDYKKQYSLTRAGLKIAKKEVILMHPGPVNRDLELESSLVDSENSVILEQVTNGVFMRMAIIDHILSFPD